MNESVLTDEVLVAFLDGELPPEEMDNVRDEIERNESLGLRARQLRDAWEMLDHLPKSKPSPTLMQSTIEMAVVSAEEEAGELRAASPGRNPVWWLAIAAALIFAAGSSFAVVRLMSPHPDQQLAEDLPIIERLDEYRDAEDIEFLRELVNAELFEPEEADDELPQ